MGYLPYLLTFVLLGGLLAFSVRNRRRQQAQEMVRISQIKFGDDVMTTSGLYGTVVGRNDDGTVQLAIAPGVEVKWALAALRDAKSLPDRYRKAIHDDDADTEPPDAEQAP
ncbi:MAG: preprotein translocase subunit YajC [Pseudonocardiales bacterium]|nr:preprotein translocase subunit YajC [Pseudonocardiales bacterium]